jgi:hypothetical protein
MGRVNHSIFSGLTVEDAASLYVMSRKNRMSPLSVSAALRAIRAVCPHAIQTDCEIVNLVAFAASTMGLAVDFDVSETRETVAPAWGQAALFGRQTVAGSGIVDALQSCPGMPVHKHVLSRSARTTAIPGRRNRRSPARH